MKDLSNVDLASVLLTFAHTIGIDPGVRNALIEAACRLNDITDV